MKNIKELKTIELCGKTYSVSTDVKVFDSKGDTLKQTISIGIESGHPQRVFENLIHEVIELAMCERELSYGGGNRRQRFFMTHGEFTMIAADVAAALLPLIGDHFSEVDE